MRDVEIRPARPEDAPALGRMGATLARLHHRLDPRRFFASHGMEVGYASWLAREMASRKAVVLIAGARSRGRERILGYAYGRLEGRDWNTLRDPAGVGVDLYVVPGARRRGTGRLLLDALVRELVRRGAPRVVIHVAARNRRALAMFEAMGFRRTVVELAMEAGGAVREGRRRAPAGRPGARAVAPAGRRAGAAPPCEMRPARSVRAILPRWPGPTGRRGSPRPSRAPPARRS